ncbi:hypothetical protein BGX38DRAFT_1279014 [Terfezia claveryi]|nr:hypothetical protein BGX38DRAFT_1279014 [Terfezia claveryi]
MSKASRDSSRDFATKVYRWRRLGGGYLDPVRARTLSAEPPKALERNPACKRNPKTEPTTSPLSSPPEPTLTAALSPAFFGLTSTEVLTTSLSSDPDSKYKGRWAAKIGGILEEEWRACCTDDTGRGGHHAAAFYAEERKGNPPFMFGGTIHSSRRRLQKLRELKEERKKRIEREELAGSQLQICEKNWKWTEKEAGERSRKLLVSERKIWQTKGKALPVETVSVGTQSGQARHVYEDLSGYEDEDEAPVAVAPPITKKQAAPRPAAKAGKKSRPAKIPPQKTPPNDKLAKAVVIHGVHLPETHGRYHTGYGSKGDYGGTLAPGE